MRDLERLLARATAWIAPVTVLAALVGGATAGLAPGLLILAAGMLLGAVLLFWSSLGRLTGESPLTLDEAVGLAAPSPEEERKRSILRALKDLDYERSVGKLSDEDFAELSTRYRTEAKALLRSVEAELAPRREKAEAKLRARLEESGILNGPDASDGREKFTKPARPSGRGREAGPAATCPSCRTMNDEDARFCKRCGATIGTAVGKGSGS
jgi:hypothetical protein